jgi:hypothetical protein
MQEAKKPRGRPKRKVAEILDKENLRKLMNLVAADCSGEGIRTFFELTNDQFYSEYLKHPEVQEMFERGAELKRTMIKMKQMEMAMLGNVPMLIHLGKSYCDQTEKTQVTGDINIRKTLDKNTINKIAQAILDEE